MKSKIKYVTPLSRLCNALFRRINECGPDGGESGEVQAKVEVSYMEIYNEKVHDLLDPMTSGTTSGLSRKLYFKFRSNGKK